MKSQLEVTDEAVGSSVTAAVVDMVRHAVFAGAVAIPMAILGVMDGVETETDFASAGEMWLEVQNRINVTSDRDL